METCVVSDNYFRSVTCLPPAPYTEGQPSQSALEQTSPEDLTCHLHDSRWTLSIDYWINLRCIMMGTPCQTCQTHLHPEDPPPL